SARPISEPISPPSRAPAAVATTLPLPWPIWEPMIPPASAPVTVPIPCLGPYSGPQPASVTPASSTAAIVLIRIVPSLLSLRRPFVTAPDGAAPARAGRIGRNFDPALTLRAGPASPSARRVG